MTAKNIRFGHISIGDSKKSFEAIYSNKITKRELESIGCRIAGLLASRNAKLGSFSAISITFVDSSPQRIEKIIDTTKSQKTIYYALPASLALESSDVEKLFIEAIFSALRSLMAEDGDLNKIDTCEERALLHRNQLRFQYRIEETRRYLVKILLSILEPYPEFRQVYLQVTDKETSKKATRLIMELHHMELDHLVAKTRIAKGKIIISPRKAFLTDDFTQRYKARGFEYPLEIDIEELLASAANLEEQSQAPAGAG